MLRVLLADDYDDDDPYSDALLDAGAASYVLKTAESRAIVCAVRRLDG